jgi:nicotinic acid mononucleotide adenylyltransferase
VRGSLYCQIVAASDLLGGSFNPAHEGHLHISQAALKSLRLDEVWWMVSPQNPLKSADGMAELDRRDRRRRRRRRAVKNVSTSPTSNAGSARGTLQIR